MRTRYYGLGAIGHSQMRKREGKKRMENSVLTDFRRRGRGRSAIEQLRPLLTFIHSSPKHSWVLTLCQALGWQQRAQRVKESQS